MRLLLFILLTASASFSQVQGGGGVASGVGRVYEASGRSAAAKGVQGKMNTALIRAVARERSPARTASSRNSSARSRTGAAASPTSPSANPVTVFKPDPRSNDLNALANELGSTPEEREQLQLLFATTKELFEKEVAAKGRSKDVAAAFTFFIATAVTVYRDDPEPSDAAVDNLWGGMGSALAEIPEVARLTNAEKQQTYDMLIGFSGLLLAGYAEGQNPGGQETKKLFQQLAGVLIQTVLKTDPNKLRFTNEGLDIIN